MVKLFAADIRQIEPKAQQLVALLSEERQARVRALGSSRAALLSLAAGLLLYDAFGDRTRGGRIERGIRGKPCLPDESPFNLTHAGNYAVLALSDRAVGVDLEQIRPIDWEKIAGRFFHPQELMYLERSQAPQKDFFQIWTLKESFLKAEGVGFSISPSSFAVLPEGRFSARLAVETAYHFTRFDAFDGYCLSVCSLESEVADRVIMRSF